MSSSTKKSLHAKELFSNKNNNSDMQSSNLDEDSVFSDAESLDNRNVSKRRPDLSNNSILFEKAKKMQNKKP